MSQNFFALVRSLSDEDKRDGAKQELQSRLQYLVTSSDGEIQITAFERSLLLEFLDTLLKKEGAGAKALEALSKIRKKVSDTKAEKEERGIRRLDKSIQMSEKELETVRDTVEKWRGGKHKFKTSAEANEWVAKERELEKTIRKDKEKIEKMRIETKSFGSLDSDDEYDFGSKGGSTTSIKVQNNPYERLPSVFVSFNV